MEKKKNFRHKPKPGQPQKPQKTEARPPIRHHPSLYGFHAVYEAWLNPDRKIDALYITSQATEGFEAALQKAKALGLSRPSATMIEKDRLDHLLPRGAVHQGIALACAPAREYDIQDFVIASQTRGRSILVILDQVTDPHNVGAILRSASAFGIHGVIMQKKHAPTLDGVLAKTACGAVEHVPVAQAVNLARAIEELQENGFFTLGLDEHSDHTLGDLDITGHDKIVLILGSEGDGMRRLIKEKCDILLRLPTQLPIASLNVSNAAAVAFFALRK